MSAKDRIAELEVQLATANEEIATNQRLYEDRIAELEVAAKPDAATLAEIEIPIEKRRNREYVAFSDALESIRAEYLAAASSDGTLVLTLSRR